MNPQVRLPLVASKHSFNTLKNTYGLHNESNQLTHMIAERIDFFENDAENIVDISDVFNLVRAVGYLGDYCKTGKEQFINLGVPYCIDNTIVQEKYLESIQNTGE